MTEYTLDLFYLDNGMKKGVITHLCKLSFDGPPQKMLQATFPQFPKSHWESEMTWRRHEDGWWRPYYDGLYIRIHYDEFKSQGRWIYFRLWRLREWMHTTSDYDDAVRAAKKFKKEYNRRLKDACQSQ